MTVVGDQDTALLKYFDCTRSGPRSAFDSNVVFQFEIMEYVCKFCFCYGIMRSCEIKFDSQCEIEMPLVGRECCIRLLYD